MQQHVHITFDIDAQNSLSFSQRLAKSGLDSPQLLPLGSQIVRRHLMKNGVFPRSPAGINQPNTP